MPIIHFSTSGKKIEVPVESNLLRTSLRWKAGIPNKCGAGLCGTCKCKIEEGSENLDHVKKAELVRLGEETIRKGYRLACQTFVRGDVSISWDPELARRLEEAKRRKNQVKRQEMVGRQQANS